MVRAQVFFQKASQALTPEFTRTARAEARKKMYFSCCQIIVDPNYSSTSQALWWIKVFPSFHYK
jgi:hypothetical protein